MDAFFAWIWPGGQESDVLRDSTYTICGFAMALQISAHKKPEFLPCLFVVDHPMLALVVLPSSNNRCNQAFHWGLCTTCMSGFNTVGDHAVGNIQNLGPLQSCEDRETRW
jgi:hypothetical protein